LLACVTLKWRYEFPLSLLLTVDPGTVQYALDVCDVCVILRHSRGPHHQLESTDPTSPWTEKSRIRVLPWPFRSTFASCDRVLIRTHPYAIPCVGRLITVLATRGSPMDGHKVPSWHEGCKHVCGVHSCPHPGAAPSFIFNPAHTHYVAFGKVASMVVSCLCAPHHTCCNFIYKLMHIKVDATMLCAIAARKMRGSVDIKTT
jgi:hypothetical protein